MTAWRTEVPCAAAGTGRVDRPVGRSARPVWSTRRPRPVPRPAQRLWRWPTGCRASHGTTPRRARTVSSPARRNTRPQRTEWRQHTADHSRTAGNPACHGEAHGQHPSATLGSQRLREEDIVRYPEQRAAVEHPENRPITTRSNHAGLENPSTGTAPGRTCACRKCHPCRSGGTHRATEGPPPARYSAPRTYSTERRSHRPAAIEAKLIRASQVRAPESSHL